MTLSASIVKSERVRLPSRTERVGQTTGLDGLWGFLFGFIFVAAGAAIALVGLKVVPVDPSSVHAPNWVLSLIGGMFAAGGMTIWSMVLQERMLVKRRQAMIACYPLSDALTDYPWDPKGVTKSPWGPMGKSLAGTLFFALFLTPFNWWAWASSEGAFTVKLIVSLFDLCLLFAVIELIRRMLVALKYGRSRLEYGTFPFRTGSRVDLRWLAPSGLESATGITFVLRCVEEWMESTGNEDPISLIHDQLWAVTCMTEGRVDWQPNRSTSLSFDVPETVPGSELSETLTITFWEFEVHVEAPGVDFQERYLVPVYSASS